MYIDTRFEKRRMSISQNDIFLHYKGTIHYDTIGNLIVDLKEKMFEAQVKQAIYKKVLMVMIEALENVFKYSENFSKFTIQDEFLPELTIYKFTDKFSITCSNPVMKEHVLSLKRKLEGINKLDKEGIREEYKRIITNGHFSEKGGAGLGIVEMAKISDCTLNFNFQPVDERFDFFSINLDINLS